MIRKLELDNFGKFASETFELENTTLFYGRNEAGKTTLFDALFYALCRPQARSRPGRRLRERYGDKARAEAVGEITSILNLPLAEEEFHNLYAIRAGEIQVEMSDSSPWLSRVRSRLFSGDLDPGVLMKGLEKLSSDKGTLRHNKEAQNVRNEYESLGIALREKTGERDSILAREERIETLEAELKQIRERIAGLRDSIQTGEEAVAREESLREQRRLLNFLRLQKDHTAAVSQRDQNSAFEHSEITELDTLEKEEQNARGRLGGEELAGKNLEKNLQSGRSLLEQQDEEQSPLIARRAALADRLQERLSASLGLTISRVLWNWPLAGAAAGLLVIGGVAAFFLSDPLFRMSAGFAGALSAALCLVFARQKEQVPDLAAREKTIRAIKDEWRLELGEEPPRTQTAEALTQELAAYRRAQEDHRQQLEAERGRLRVMESQLEQSRNRRDQLREELAVLEKTRQAWFAQRNVESRDTYIMRLGEYAKWKAECDRLESEIRAQSDGADPEDFALECERRLRIFDEQGLSGEARPENELRAWRAKLERMRTELDELTRRESEWTAQQAGESGEVRGSLGRLTAEIMDLEQRRLELEAKLHQSRLDKQAAGLALSIFEDLQSDSQVMLEQLVEDLGETVAEILPGSVNISGPQLDLRNFRLHDAGGASRPLENLSTGTRDCFVFAARIALARRALEGRGVLILDEPFLSLDAERERACLEFLRNFQERHAWQIILLTKEGRLFQTGREVFPEARVHELQPGVAVS